MQRIMKLLKGERERESFFCMCGLFASAFAIIEKFQNKRRRKKVEFVDPFIIYQTNSPTITNKNALRTEQKWTKSIHSQQIRSKSTSRRQKFQSGFLVKVLKTKTMAQ